MIENIDKLLVEADCLTRSKKKMDSFAAKGVTIREYQTGVEPANKLLAHINRNEWITAKPKT